ncbi:NAD(P)H-dependent oxidoreductase [Furfurilactobacillus milii]|uniref:NAD(P)H-dependent oxidoreductase n=1 Tax=Furfurilactobacillus milii TaxID=2888272 RepID=A0ABT6DA26_9LACO|nr:NAD(P)H-dependent oxidoreductase [Furfurilactobacillus milii]QLE65411.1 NADPH-quinone reductase modulator of drug activity B [Furfurilactobacillus rossiae]MCF6160909.1 NAD(P)H-dependent oxidoreductase [Furfurilactobacillus milii]MCF6163325.1 NAD(P)H-dependent oxidoreductase [Furfurilactobacillus milii]MDF9913980.1 NAD(P)H-dependent oxidoreductase [Furfurilactobacillus milii]QLE67840.1 NADPH-quinone reductase modulator of drug activity B [Furfurilactobacillus rossiae]
MQSKTTVVYCHPYDKSFNHQVLMAVQEKLDQLGEVYDVIDLYKDQFDPRYSVAELAKFKDGDTTDPLVTKYQTVLRSSTNLIIITPIWWNDLPGMLKGFFDKVMKPQFAYVNTPRGVKGRMTNIKRADVLTTSTSPTWYLKLFSGNAIKPVFMGATLKQLGIKQRHWTNCGGITNSHFSQRQAFLKQIVNQI